MLSIIVPNTHDVGRGRGLVYTDSVCDQHPLCIG